MTRLQDGYNSITKTTSVVALADGRKPFGKPNQFGNEIFLVPFWEQGMPNYFTRGNQLRHDYSNVIHAKRGVWYLKAKEAADGWNDVSIRFYDTLKNNEEEFAFITFEGIRFKFENELIVALPSYDNDDYNVLLEESLSSSDGVLAPAFQALAKGVLAKKANPYYSISPVDIVKKANSGENV
jgi:hypothetical protein